MADVDSKLVLGAMTKKRLVMTHADSKLTSQSEICGPLGEGAIAPLYRSATG